MVSTFPKWATSLRAFISPIPGISPKAILCLSEISSGIAQGMRHVNIQNFYDMYPPPIPLPAEALPFIHIYVNTLLLRRGFLIAPPSSASRSEEHTSELQSRLHLLCSLLL